MQPEQQVDVYKEVLTAIVKRFITLMGTPAIKLARRVYGLHIDDEGNVLRYQGDGFVIVQGLVVEYMALLGSEVVPLTQRAINLTRERNPDIKLPAMLN